LRFSFIRSLDIRNTEDVEYYDELFHKLDILKICHQNLTSLLLLASDVFLTNRLQVIDFLHDFLFQVALLNIILVKISNLIKIEIMQKGNFSIYRDIIIDIAKQVILLYFLILIFFEFFRSNLLRHPQSLLRNYGRHERFSSYAWWIKFRWRMVGFVALLV